jgi:hypothetical protein
MGRRHFREFLTHAAILSSVNHGTGGYHGMNTGSNVAILKDVMYGTLLDLPGGAVLTKFGLAGVTGSSKVKYALYNLASYTAPYPTRWAHNFGEFASANAVNTLGSPLVVPPGAYWATALFESNLAAVGAHEANQRTAFPVFGVSAVDRVSQLCGLMVPRGYAQGFPEVFPETGVSATGYALNFNWAASSTSNAAAALRPRS